MFFVVTPKFCISVVFSFSWGHFNSKEETENNAYTQNFGVTNKERYNGICYGIFCSGQLSEHYYNVHEKMV